MINGQMTEVETTVPVVDVHKLLDYLRTELKLVPPREVVERYWRHLRENGMPHAKFFEDDHIPFSLYGDECVLGDPKDKVTGIYLSLTLFKPKSIREGQFLLFCMQDEHMIHDQLKTLRPVPQHLVWSCNVAFSGVYPELDAFGQQLPMKKRRMAGTKLAGDCRYACAELKGDWKYHFPGNAVSCAMLNLLMRPCGTTVLEMRLPGLQLKFPRLVSSIERFGRDHSETKPISSPAFGAQFLSYIIIITGSSYNRVCEFDPAGPFLHLRGFHVTMIKFCSMHVCNLGLVHTASGGAL